MSKKTQEHIEGLSLDSQIFLETQEDFVFNREIISKPAHLDYENIELGFDDWMETERVLKEISATI